MKAIKYDLTEIKNGSINKGGNQNLIKEQPKEDSNIKEIKDEIKAMNQQIEKVQQETSSMIESKMDTVQSDMKMMSD